VVDYTQKSFDPALKTVRMGVRDYAPELGSFAQPDLAVFLEPTMCLASVVDCTLWSYGNNNPVVFTDPTGQASIFIDFIDVGANWTPFINTGREFNRAVFGVDPINAEQLGLVDRINSSLSVGLDIASFGVVGTFSKNTSQNIAKNLSKPLMQALDSVSNSSARSLAAKVAAENFKLDQIAKHIPSRFHYKIELASKEVGTIIAGAGHQKTINDLPRLINRYGGSAEDWVKMSSSKIIALQDGNRFGVKPFKGISEAFYEVHWYENLKTGIRTDTKIILDINKSRGPDVNLDIFK